MWHKIKISVSILNENHFSFEHFAIKFVLYRLFFTSNNTQWNTALKKLTLHFYIKKSNFSSEYFAIKFMLQFFFYFKYHPKNFFKIIIIIFILKQRDFSPQHFAIQFMLKFFLVHISRK